MVDGQGQLLGIVTQSDLIAALYADRVGSAAAEGFAGEPADRPGQAVDERPDTGPGALAWHRRGPERLD